MKQDIDSILLANWYLITCKVENKSDDSLDVARKYLVSKIKNALSRRSKAKLDKSLV